MMVMVVVVVYDAGKVGDFKTMKYEKLINTTVHKQYNSIDEVKVFYAVVAREHERAYAMLLHKSFEREKKTRIRISAFE